MTRPITNRELNKCFGHLEDHQYRGYNKALGCFVENKEHFRKLMSTGKFIPYEIAEKYCEQFDNKESKYSLSTKATDIIKSIKLTKDKHGNIKLGGRAIEALKEIGVIPSDEQQESIFKNMKRNELGKNGFANGE